MVFAETVMEFILQCAIVSNYPVDLSRGADRPDHRMIERMGQGEAGRQSDLAVQNDPGEDLGIFQTHFYYMSVSKKSYCGNTIPVKNKQLHRSYLLKIQYKRMQLRFNLLESFPAEKFFGKFHRVQRGIAVRNAEFIGKILIDHRAADDEFEIIQSARPGKSDHFAHGIHGRSHQR